MTDGIKIIAKNKKAYFNYHISDTFEAGIQLLGSEVKSLRDGKVQLKDSYVDFQAGEMFLVSMHIGIYEASSYLNHAPERPRKLLMKKTEIDRLNGRVREGGFTLVPLKIYFKKGWAKVQLGLGKGKKLHDKRETIKKRDENRNLRRVVRRG